METFEGRIAVVTGGGTGMGRELTRHLARAGCHVATCDVSPGALVETKARALAESPDGTRVITFVADVSREEQLVKFREFVTSELSTSHINLLFNNAGIAGGGSFLTDSRDDWERTFDIDWGGVYLTTRTFIPLLLASKEGHLVNTSSVNGLLGSIGPFTPHTAYSSAKFAVRGFTESLMTDFRVHAPHVRVSVVLPGHVGTSIVINSGVAHGMDPETMDSDALRRVRSQIAGRGIDIEAVSDDDLRKGIKMMGEAFRDAAPTTASDAAELILEGVRQQRWRILIGDDARTLDVEVRADPEHAYDPEFWEMLQSRGLFHAFGG